MKGIKRIFGLSGKRSKRAGREDSAPCGYRSISIEDSLLSKLPVAQLCNIVYRYDNEIARLESHLELKSRLLAQTQTQLSQAQAHNNLLEQTNEDLSSKIIAMEEEYRTAQDSVDNSALQLQVKAAAAKEKDALIENYKRQLANLGQQLSELHFLERQDWPVENKLELFQIKSEVFTRNQDAAALEALETTNRVLENDVAAVTLHNAALKHQKDQLQAALEQAHTQRSSIEEELAVAVERIRELKHSVRSQRSEQEELHGELQATFNSLSECKGTVKQLRAKVSRKKEKIKELVNELSTLRLKLEEANYGNFVKLMKQREEINEQAQSAQKILNEQITQLQRRLEEVQVVKVKKKRSTAQLEDQLAKTKAKLSIAKLQVVGKSHSSSPFLDEAGLLRVKSKVEQLYRELLHAADDSAKVLADPAQKSVVVSFEEWTSLGRRLNQLVCFIGELLNQHTSTPGSPRKSSRHKTGKLKLQIFT